MKSLKSQIKNLPDSPGVYFFKDDRGKILYIGKAGSLKKRVLSYFSRPQEAKNALMLEKAAKIDFQKTDSVIEALFLESDLIKKYNPPYNIKEKDDKSYLYVGTSCEQYPRVDFFRAYDIAKLGGRINYHGHSPWYPQATPSASLFSCASSTGRTRGFRASKIKGYRLFGPYTSATAIRQSLDILRKILPFRTCKKQPHRPCLFYQMYKLPAPCDFEVSVSDYRKTIQNLVMFLQGKKKRLIQKLEKEMGLAARKNQFEKAGQIRDQIFALKHLQDIAVLKREEKIKVPHRIECYDISNIGGKFATGSMVVFTDGVMDKDEYRRFQIKTVKQIDDVGMLKEVLQRRFNHTDWSNPDIILVDGGRGQLNGVLAVLKKKGIAIPVVALAKREKGVFLYQTEEILPLPENIIVQLRDEAHRFAVKYHRYLRDKI
jgi:excinuclease ABC subunit C